MILLGGKENLVNILDQCAKETDDFRQLFGLAQH